MSEPDAGLEPGGDPAQERGLERLILFSDAVVAIAITLLVLPLLDIADKPGDLGTVLSDESSRILMFFVSFAVVASFWVNHRETFDDVVGTTNGIVWADVLWLATIAFLPFPTEVLGVRGADEASVRAFYVGSLLAVSAAQLLLSTMVLTAPSVWRGGRRPGFSQGANLATTMLFVAIFLVATFVPAVGLWALLGLFLTGLLSRRLDRPASSDG